MTINELKELFHKPFTFSEFLDKTKINETKAEKILNSFRKDFKIFFSNGKFRFFDGGLNVGTLKYEGGMHFSVDGIKVFKSRAFYAFSGAKVVYRIGASVSKGEVAYVYDIIEPFPQKTYGYLTKEKIFETFLKSNFSFLFETSEDFKSDTVLLVKLTPVNLNIGLLKVEVLKTLDSLTGRSGDIVRLVYEFGFHPKFPEDVILESRKIKGAPLMTPLTGNIYTIDAVSAKDLDDAIKITKVENGYQVGVYIADVGFYVRNQSKIACEALFRTTSLYLSDYVFPMLPEAISNGVCSLKKGEMRKVIGVEFFLTNEGLIEKRTIKPLTIVVSDRLSYEGLERALINKEEKYHRLALLFKEVLGVLKARDVHRRRINFTFPEYFLELDKNGFLLNFVNRKRYTMEDLIEELMIIANETVASFLKETNIDMIYRVHDRPPVQKEKMLKGFLKAKGFLVKERLKASTYNYLDKALPDNLAYRSLLLRSLAKAEYTASNIGHFGLGSFCYTHFTAPIRRFSDLYINWLIHKELFKEEGYTLPDIEAVISSINEKEKNALTLERTFFSIKGAEYMEKHIGLVYQGIIMNIQEFGMFVNFNDGFEGLVVFRHLKRKPIVNLKDGFVIINSKHYEIGGKIKVRVKHANKWKGEIDLEIVSG